MKTARKTSDSKIAAKRIYAFDNVTVSEIDHLTSEEVVSHITREHEIAADANAPRTRDATVWRIEHRDDYANTVY